MAIVNKVSLDAYVIGTVLEINRENRNIAVYIPKFMPGIASGSSQSQSLSTGGSATVTGIENESQIRIRNSIWVQPEDYREPLPKVGSKVIIWIVEGNPKTSYWKPFNPNNNYEVLDEEKYNPLFTLGVGDYDLNIFEEDNVTLELSDSFEVIKNINDVKKVTMKINIKDKYIISEIEPVSPEQGTMWANTSDGNVYLFNGTIFENLNTVINSDSDLRYIQQDLSAYTLAATLTNTDKIFLDSSINKYTTVDDIKAHILADAVLLDTGAQTIVGDLTITGTFTAASQSIASTVGGDYLTLRSGAGILAGTSGLVIENFDGAGTNFEIIIDGAGELSVGPVGSLHGIVYTDTDQDIDGNKTFVNDINIQLPLDGSSDPVVGASRGITINRGNGTNVSLFWNEAVIENDSAWTVIDTDDANGPKKVIIEYDTLNGGTWS